MPRRLISKYLPSVERLRGSAMFGVLGHRLFDPELWHMTRRSLRIAAGVGTFCALLPMPFQMVLAAAGALLLRCNLPLAVALVWLTNPLTMLPVLYVTYFVGTLLLGEPVADVEVSLAWLTQQYTAVFIGSVVVGLVLGLAAAMTLDIAWRFVIARRWRHRARRRRLAAARDAGNGG